MLHWTGLALIAAAWMPALAASLLALTARAGDHEVWCTATDNGFEVTLHHPQPCAGHHHNPLERLFLGRGVPGEADHHLGYRSAVVDPELESLPPVDGAVFAVVTVPAEPRQEEISEARIAVSGDERWRGPPPGWRGVVMRM